jgi:hypothetical protein
MLRICREKVPAGLAAVGGRRIERRPRPLAPIAQVCRRPARLRGLQRSAAHQCIHSIVCDMRPPRSAAAAMAWTCNVQLLTTCCMLVLCFIRTPAPPPLRVAMSQQS